ncbi:MAG: hypothetical protein HeimC3_36230 [Candidatus Heimdallarchaeota archaeon LC_3]|nr:MAG: hypothetical protein HeimC3_36230 [Candidatus Heimdallarchaeota archaeon LC_3]
MMILTKKLKIGLILIIVVIPLLSFTIISEANPRIKLSDNYKLLIITNDDSDIKTVDYLLSLRTDIDSSILLYLEVSDHQEIDDINSNNVLNQQIIEFWFIVSDLEDDFYNPLEILLSKLILRNIPGVILTTEYNDIPSNLLNEFSIISCQEELIQTEDDISLTITYPNANNLSKFGLSISPTENVFLKMEIVDCQITSNIYEIAVLDDIQDEILISKPTLIYKPEDNSSLTIGTFIIEKFEENSILKLKFQEINQIEISLLTIVSQISKYDLEFFLEAEGINTETNPQSTNPGIQLNTIDFSGFFRTFATWVIPISAITGFIGVILFLIRKYWMIIFGLFISIGTALYIPNRKLDAVQVVHHSSRQRIMDMLLEAGEKGRTFRKLSNNLLIPTPTLLWHLNILEDFDLIKRIKIRREVVIIAEEYFNDFDPIVKELELSFKSDQGIIFRNFLISLNMDKYFSLETVIKLTKWNRKTALRHLNRLLDLKILKKDPSSKVYVINPKYFVSVKELSTIEFN